MVAYGPLDPDESQHLHVAWLIAEGHVPYADFWEHHTPLLHYGLAPLTRSLAEGPAVYFVGRATMGLAAAATLVLVYLLGRRLGPGVGGAAVLLLGVQWRFLEHSIQVRPDSPALVTWMATVLMLVSWRERDTPWRLWATGLGLGLTATITPKAAYTALGMIAVVLTASPTPLRALGQATRRLALLAAGCAVPLTALGGWLWYTGGSRALHSFWQDVVVANLHFPDFVKQVPVGVEGIGFMLLALAGIAMIAHREGPNVLRHQLHGPLLIPPALMTGLLLWPRTPAVYSYTWLPVVAIASVYAGLALVAIRARALASAGRFWRVLMPLTVMSTLLAPALATGAVLLFHKNDNEAELRRMRRELAYACRGEAVLDARPLAVTRPTALRYPSLVMGVRSWIASGVIPADTLVSDLLRAQAPVGVLDARLQRLGEPVASLIARYYVREPDGLLIAGASLSVSGGTGETEIDLLVAGLHEVRLSPGVHARVDAVDVTSSFLPLSSGRHRVSWSGAPGVVQVTIAPCAERRGVRVFDSAWSHVGAFKNSAAPSPAKTMFAVHAARAGGKRSA